jgi:hypothetical protein
MATQTRVNGLAGDVGVLNGKTGAIIGASVKFYKITAKVAAGTAVDLTSLDDAPNEAFEKIMRVMPSGILAFYAANDASGVISVVVDGHAAPLATTGDVQKPGLQEIIRNLGATVGASDGLPGVDLSGTTVETATGFTVLV